MPTVRARPGCPEAAGAEGLGDRTLLWAARPGRAVGSAMTSPAPRSPHQVVPELLAAHIVHGLAAQRRCHGVSAAVGKGALAWPDRLTPPLPVTTTPRAARPPLYGSARPPAPPLPVTAALSPPIGRGGPASRARPARGDGHGQGERQGAVKQRGGRRRGRGRQRRKARRGGVAVG